MNKPGAFRRSAKIALGSNYAKAIWRSILAMGVHITLTIAAPSGATTWRIQVDGQGDAPSVQAGIDSSVSGDTVLVSPGTYYENIDFLGKNVVLRSESGPLATTLDGSSRTDSVVKFHNRETRGAMIIGFTITGGEGTTDFGSPSGGGIKCSDASPIIRQNRIVGNSISSAPGNGGGIGVGLPTIPIPRPNPLIEDNIFENNTAVGNGGALSIFHADAEVRNNVFRGNSTDGDGGAIWVAYYDARVIVGMNEFWENRAEDHGGGLYVVDIGGMGRISIEGNLLVRNEAAGLGTGDTGSGGGVWLNGVSGNVTQNTLVGNVGSGESACSGGGILLDGTPADLDIRANIIAFSSGCGIACKNTIQTSLGSNLFWENAGGNLGTGSGSCPGIWTNNQIFQDPIFCNAAIDVYTVAGSSPALNNGAAMGAYPNPGCPPYVSVTATTWGRLKTMYR